MIGRANLKKLALNWNVVKRWIRDIAVAMSLKIRDMTRAASLRIRDMTRAASLRIRDIKIVAPGYHVSGSAAFGSGSPTGFV